MDGYCLCDKTLVRHSLRALAGELRAGPIFSLTDASSSRWIRLTSSILTHAAARQNTGYMLRPSDYGA